MQLAPATEGEGDGAARLIADAFVTQGSEDVLAARDSISAWSNAAMQACLLHRDCQAEAQLLQPVLGAIGGCLDAIIVCM